MKSNRGRDKGRAHSTAEEEVILPGYGERLVRKGHAPGCEGYAARCQVEEGRKGRGSCPSKGWPWKDTDTYLFVKRSSWSQAAKRCAVKPWRGSDSQLEAWPLPPWRQGPRSGHWRVMDGVVRAV